MPPAPHDLADHNLVEATREHARWQHPCELVEADGLLTLTGANEFPAAAPHVIGFVLYRGGQALATALTVLSGNSAGVYWVATVSAARRQGLGEIVTRLATNAGFAAGASVITLQATRFGEPIYRRLGYKTYDRLRRYRHAPPA